MREPSLHLNASENVGKFDKLPMTLQKVVNKNRLVWASSTRGILNRSSKYRCLLCSREFCLLKGLLLCGSAYRFDQSTNESIYSHTSITRTLGNSTELLLQVISLKFASYIYQAVCVRRRAKHDGRK